AAGIQRATPRCAGTSTGLLVPAWRPSATPPVCFPQRQRRIRSRTLHPRDLRPQWLSFASPGKLKISTCPHTPRQPAQPLVSEDVHPGRERSTALSIERDASWSLSSFLKPQRTHFDEAPGNPSPAAE